MSDTDLHSVKADDPPARELRRDTYRVFKFDERTAAPGQQTWMELEPMSGEGEYGYRPSAGELGETWGAGEFLLIEASGTYPSARFVSVVAETVYREYADEEPGA